MRKQLPNRDSQHRRPRFRILYKPRQVVVRGRKAPWARCHPRNAHGPLGRTTICQSRLFLTVLVNEANCHDLNVVRSILFVDRTVRITAS